MNILFSNINTSTNQESIKESEVETDFVRKSTIRQKERFLKGPIPMREIATAASLPGQALALLLAIHHQGDLTGKPWVTLPARLLGELGISRDAKARALKVLEYAGLITVARSHGRAARIQLQRNKEER
jgi:DNA-binding MarR family transcriptional regulator